MNHATEEQLQIAAFRHHLIATALQSDEGGVSARLQKVALGLHRTADGTEVQVALGTLWKWLAAYRKGGLLALCPKIRKDRGVLRAFPPDILETAMRLRQENPYRSSNTIIKFLEGDHQVTAGTIARSTLDRHLDLKDYSRRRLGTLAQQTFGIIATGAPFELLVGDFHHGPHVRLPDGTTKQALYLGFIDHYSRFVPEGRYYLSENFAALRFGFRHLVLAHGMPLRLYMDNGSAFHSHRFHAACNLLGIKLIHSRPYCPESRGVIERFNRTLKEQFESEVNCREHLPTLDELNGWLDAWLAERYHDDVHSETRESPGKRFGGTLAGRPAPDLDLLDECLRLMAIRTVQKKTSTVEVAGIRFVVNSSLRGRKVKVLYDPSDLAYVLVTIQDRAVERAFPQAANVTPPPQEPVAPFEGPRSDYLAQMRTSYESKKREELATLQLQPAPSEQDLPGLIALLAACRGNPLSDPELNLVSAFWRRLRPLDLDLTTRFLASALRRLGPGLHLSVYLKDLEEPLLRLRSTPKAITPGKAAKPKPTPKASKAPKGAK